MFAGEVHALVGENSAGKSLTFREVDALLERVRRLRELKRTKTGAALH